MRANQSLHTIDSTALNIASQESAATPTPHEVNGSSSLLVGIEGEPFSPAELAAIFALSKAQATLQTGISSNHLATQEPSNFKIMPGPKQLESDDEGESEYPLPSWDWKGDYGRKQFTTSSKMKSGKVATEGYPPKVENSIPSRRPSNSTRSSMFSARGYQLPTEEEEGDSERGTEEEELANEDTPADHEMELDTNDGESECSRRTTSPEFTAEPNSRGWVPSQETTKSPLRARPSRREPSLVRVAPYDTRVSRSPPSPKAERDRRAPARTVAKRGRRSRPKPDFPKAPSRRHGIAEGSFHIPPLSSPVEPLDGEQVKDLQNMAAKVFLALSMAKRPCRKDELVWLIGKLIPEHRNSGWRGWENTLSQCLSMEPSLIAYESDYVKGYHWWKHDQPHDCTPADLFKEKPPGKYPHGTGVNKNRSSKSLTPETTPEPPRRLATRMTAVPRVIVPASRSSTRKILSV